MNFWVLVAIMTPVFLFLAVSRNQRSVRTTRSATIELEADAMGLRRRLHDGRTEQIDWTEVIEVDVFTTRLGPHKPAGGAAVFYGDDERGCIVPLDRIADIGLFDHLHRLPRFDLNAFIDAVTSSDRRDRDTTTNPAALLSPRPMQVTTVIWKRDHGDHPSSSDSPDRSDDPAPATDPSASTVDPSADED